jgi:hypothetical protein
MAALIARARVAESILTSYDHTAKSQPGLFEVDRSGTKAYQPRRKWEWRFEPC